MSTIKISQLTPFGTGGLSSNTTNIIVPGVNLTSDVTGIFTVTDLANQLYVTNGLNVGTSTVGSNTLAKFVGADLNALQVNLQNSTANGSGNFTVTSDTGGANNYVSLGITNSKFANSYLSSLGANDSYLIARGPSTTAFSGNLVIGTASANANVYFIAGNTQSIGVVAKITKNGLGLVNGSTFTFSDGSVQSTASLAPAYSQASYAAANTSANSIALIQAVDAYQNTVISGIQASGGSSNSNVSLLFAIDNAQNTSITAIQGVDLTQNNNITIVQGGLNTANAIITVANNNAFGAFAKANAAIANTAGVFTAGDFNISGNLTVLGVGTTGVMTVNAAAFSANTPGFRVTGSANGYSQPPLNQGYMMQITGFANTSSRIVNDAFGANVYPVYVGRQARGSSVVPAATANGDVLLRIAGNGWGNSFSQFGQSRIDFVASENFTDSNKGTEIQIWNTTIGSNTLNKIATFNSTELTITGQLKPLKGFVWYPRTFPAAQTAITLDFSSDAVIRANTSAGLVVSFANYTAGKVVDMWITNTAGTNQTFTHGCSALNSTVNSTTYTIPSTSSIFVKYMSFGGDIGNTFCAITHA